MLGVVLLFFVTALFEYLWNTTMPQIFNFRFLTFWQAFRLLLIGCLITGGGLIHFNLGH